MKYVLLTILTALVTFQVQSCAGQQWRKSKPLLGKEGRIIGGGAAERGHFPHAAFLSIDGGVAGCGATLLNDKWLLTAALCVYQYSEWVVYLGLVDLATSDDYTQIFQSNTWLEHPGYSNDSKSYDIGLVYVPGRVFFNEYIMPAYLPRYSDLDSTFEGSEITICGWGSQATGGAHSQALWYAYFEPVTICSPPWSFCGVGRYGESICSGDFGGPMQRLEADGNYTVVGVANFVQGTTTCEGATSGFTMVAAFLDWLHQHTQIPISP